jgi:hypothetical protein
MAFLLEKFLFRDFKPCSEGYFLFFWNVSPLNVWKLNFLSIFLLVFFPVI